MSVTKILYHVARDGWTGQADVADTDVAASFEAWLDALEAALVVAYPEADVVVYSHAGDYSTRVELDMDPPDADPADTQEEIELLSGEVWQDGDFWVPLPAAQS